MKQTPTRPGFTQDHDDRPQQFEGYQPCRVCRRPMLLAVLAQHGGLCVGCFDDYCQQSSPYRTFGEPGFRDTAGQYDMRPRIRQHRRAGVVHAPTPIEEQPVDLEQRKRESERQVEAYRRAHGIST